MKISKYAVFTLTALLSAAPAFSQTNLNFNAVAMTSEGALRLSWNSTSNEVYEIDEADGLNTNSDGTTTWNFLYGDYPSQGTNTIWLDTGNYFLQPTISHPSRSPMRFYRILLTGTNTAPAPTVAISSPTNGATLSGDVTVVVSISSTLPIVTPILYVDGQEMPRSDDGTNFVINTCEWPNGPHTLYVVAKGVSTLAGTPNDPNMPTRGYAVSSFQTVNFDNLITSLAFTQPYFEPAFGQTQTVSASFMANVNWTLDILDLSSNAIRTVTGSGGSLQYDWDGTGTGNTNLPAGVYYFKVTASTNGLALPSGGGGDGGGDGGTNDLPPIPSFARSSSLGSDTLSEIITLPPLPPGVSYGLDENGNEITNLVETIIRPARRSSFGRFASASFMSGGTGGAPFGLDASTPTSQFTIGPIRPPNMPGLGTVGTFGIGYQLYGSPGTVYSTPRMQNIPGVPGSYIALDGGNGSSSENWGDITENAELANNFNTAMTFGRYKGTVIKANDNLLPSDLTGGTFNSVNVALISVHCSYATTAYFGDNVYHTYLRLRNAGGNSVIPLDTCSFGGSGTNGLKYLALLACSALRDQNFNSMRNHSKLPINNDLHLVCSASTVATAAPAQGGLWARNMIFGGTNGVPQTVSQAWFNAGNIAYLGETNHVTITLRVAGWPDAFSEHITDIANTPGTGSQSDITSLDSTVFNNP